MKTPPPWSETKANSKCSNSVPYTTKIRKKLNIVSEQFKHTIHNMQILLQQLFTVFDVILR